MIRKSGQRAVPQTLIGDEMVIGFNRGRLEALLRPYEGEATPRPSNGFALGVRVADARTHAPTHGVGAYIGHVKPGSRAERHGLQVGDVVTGLAGQPVATADDLISISQKIQTQRPIAVTYLRHGQQRQVMIDD